MSLFQSIFHPSNRSVTLPIDVTFPIDLSPFQSIFHPSNWCHPSNRPFTFPIDLSPFQSMSPFQSIFHPSNRCHVSNQSFTLPIDLLPFQSMSPFQSICHLSILSLQPFKVTCRLWLRLPSCVFLKVFQRNVASIFTSPELTTCFSNSILIVIHFFTQIPIRHVPRYEGLGSI